jgi:hypothetical protein
MAASAPAPRRGSPRCDHRHCEGGSPGESSGARGWLRAPARRLWASPSLDLGVSHLNLREVEQNEPGSGQTEGTRAGLWHLLKAGSEEWWLGWEKTASLLNKAETLLK